MTTGWSLYVIVLVVVNIVGCAWLLFANRNVKINKDAKGNSTGHSFDGIEELNNPLPAWWTWLFIGSIVFGVGYFVLYPGFGNFEGVLGWSSAGEVKAAQQEAEKQYGPLFQKYLQTPIPELVREEQAVAMGSRIFANRCSVCHGSDARGGPGYPNLTDDDWLHGGSPEKIVQTIAYGRNGVMPPFAAAIGGEPGVENVVEYVLSLSGREHDEAKAAAGKANFQAVCGICHGANGKGNPDLGSPNLTDNIWLYGGRRSDIARAVNNGIASQMPAHSEILSPARIHLAAAYVYSLSQGNEPDQASPGDKD